MKGSVRRRTQSSWEITLDLGRDAQGKRQRKFVHVKGKKADAERRLRELLTSWDRGIPLADDHITVAVWLDKWMSEYVTVDKRPKTLERYRGIIDRHIVPRIGHHRIAKLSPGDIKGLQSSLTAEGMAPAGVELVHTVLSGALKYALIMEVIWRNPAQGVTPPKRPRRELASPEIDEVRRILQKGHEADHVLYPALHLVAYTGVRRGEALGLRWSDVDLEGGSITTNSSVIRTQDLGITIQPPKTAASRRKIDIDPDTVEILRQHKIRQMEHRLIIGAAYEDNDLVFPDAFGKPLNPMALTRAYKSLARWAGVPEGRLHSLRHFHASALFDQGESPMLVSRRLGHASIKTTVDIYGHLFEGAQKQAAETFGKAMRG
jgi:integrase